MPKARQIRPEARQCTVTNDTNKLQLSATNSVKDAIHLASRKKILSSAKLREQSIGLCGEQITEGTH